MTRAMIDLDGVMADFTLGYTRVARELGFIDKAWTTHIQDSWQWDHAIDDKKVWSHIISSMNWWLTLEPIVSYAEIDELNKAITDHSIYFVTNRSNTRGLPVEMQSRLWLEGLGVRTNRTTVIATKGSKGELCAALDLDIGIDDKVSNIKDMADSCEPIVRAWKYNEELEGQFTRVKSLSEFLKRLY